jgi:hypothetical protein
VALWDRMRGETVETLYREGVKTGRLLVLQLRPRSIGQPFRTGYLDEAPRRSVRRRGVWAATGAAIIDWYPRDRPVSPARP